MLLVREGHQFVPLSPKLIVFGVLSRRLLLLRYHVCEATDVESSDLLSIKILALIALKKCVVISKVIKG